MCPSYYNQTDFKSNLAKFGTVKSQLIHDCTVKLLRFPFNKFHSLCRVRMVICMRH